MESTKEHGRKSKLFYVWAGLNRRCRTPGNPKFPRYGGRGIKVCDEWLSYKSFKKWALSNGYEEGLMMDRTDNNGNYEPCNCRFVTPHKSAINRSTTKMNFTKASILRALHGAGLTNKRLMELFGIGSGSVSDIANHNRW